MGGDAGGVGSGRDERGIVFAVRRVEIFAADVLAAEAAQGIWAGAGREQLPGQISPVCWRRRGEKSRVHRALVVELGGGGSHDGEQPNASWVGGRSSAGDGLEPGILSFSGRGHREHRG
jgi:hypothetical protein